MRDEIKVAHMCASAEAVVALDTPANLTKLAILLMNLTMKLHQLYVLYVNN